MAQDALIKLRCSQELKDRLMALAKKRHQKLSDYIRQRLIDAIEAADSKTSMGQENSGEEADLIQQKMEGTPLDSSAQGGSKGSGQARRSGRK